MKSSRDEQFVRRMEMVVLRKKALTFGQIGAKFGVSGNTARVIIMSACNNEDPHPYKQKVLNKMTKLVKNRINDLEIENAELRREQPSLRDQFAMAAMHVVGANTAWQKPIDSLEAALTAYRIADAMMDARDVED
jgi:mannose/cellobiose epimerase-like protein (N-acyl-D-glucosamine 2-epimerase family)